jgi:hypothetical protein
MRVREARDRYLEENGFTLRQYEAPTFTITLFGLTWSLPNGAARRRAVPLHDLHHVATGYGTALSGEAETSAFELRGGINSLFLWCFKLAAVTIGLFVAPRRVARSFAVARGARTLYVDDMPYDALLALSLGELRARLGIPQDGLADRPSSLHARAPGRALSR